MRIRKEAYADNTLQNGVVGLLAIRRDLPLKGAQKVPHDGIVEKGGIDRGVILIFDFPQPRASADADKRLNHALRQDIDVRRRSNRIDLAAHIAIGPCNALLACGLRVDPRPALLSFELQLFQTNAPGDGRGDWCGTQYPE